MLKMDKLKKNKKKNNIWSKTGIILKMNQPELELQSVTMHH